MDCSAMAFKETECHFEKSKGVNSGSKANEIEQSEQSKRAISEKCPTEV